MVVRGRPRDYRDAHPSTPVLMVEVADRSLRLDRLRKGSLYARAGVADYWILNLVDEVLEVYRQPLRPASRRYGRSAAVTAGTGVPCSKSRQGRG